MNDPTAPISSRKELDALQYTVIELFSSSSTFSTSSSSSSSSSPFFSLPSSDKTQQEEKKQERPGKDFEASSLGSTNQN